MRHGSIRFRDLGQSTLRPGELPEFREPVFTSFDQNPRGTWFRETEDGFEVGAFYGLGLEFYINLVLTLGMIAFAVWVFIGYGAEIEPKALFFVVTGLPILIAASFTVACLRDVRVRLAGEALIISRGVYKIRRIKRQHARLVRAVRITPRVYGPAGIFSQILGKRYGRLQIAPTMAMNSEDDASPAAATGVNFSVSLETDREEIVLSERLNPAQTFFLRFVLREKMAAYAKEQK